jgi:CheY-like chemotaxis protein
MAHKAATQTRRHVETDARPKILVVDPDETTRSGYREALRAIGADVNEAEDGRDALVQAMTGGPGVIIIGQAYLPFIDAHALCALLRRDPATERSHIIMVTANDPDQMALARSAGADTVLAAPIPLDLLANEIRRPSAPRDSDASRPRVLAHVHERFTTTTPPLPPPDLQCPSCDSALIYEQSYIGGTNERSREQWDYYKCAGDCGAFQYRQRTRRVRRLAP